MCARSALQEIQSLSTSLSKRIDNFDARNLRQLGELQRDLHGVEGQVGWAISRVPYLYDITPLPIFLLPLHSQNEGAASATAEERLPDGTSPIAVCPSYGQPSCSWPTPERSQSVDGGAADCLQPAPVHRTGLGFSAEVCQHEC